MNELKYWNIFCTRGARRPATLRSVCVKDREPVACRTERPCRESSPNSESAMTLLPLPGPPVTMTAVLVLAPPCLLHRVQHEVVGVPLLVEEGEHLAVLHLLRGEGEKLLRRRDPAVQQMIGGFCSVGAGRETALQEVLELASTLAGEHPAVVVAREAEEVVRRRSRSRCGGRRHRQPSAGRPRGRGEAEEVVAVVPHLQGGVRHRPSVVLLDRERGCRSPRSASRGSTASARRRRRRAGRSRVRAGEDDVGALARQRQLVLEKHLHVVPRPASMRSARRAGRLRSQERRSAGLAD